MANEIDEIKNQIDIIDVVQEYVDLTKKGRNYWGVCPFHNDSNPSMSVSAEKQMYNCFSCGEAGGIFKFVQNIEKIPFKEALKKLGDKVGIEIKLKKEVKKYTERQELIINSLNDAMDYYKVLIDSEDGTIANEYVEKRGITPQIREKFNIGYASGNGAINFLKNIKNYDESVLINASLVNSVGRDFFQNRIIFGISNDYGDIVAMSGRTLGEDSAKYINSAESIVFKKGNILYNWHNAKESARRENEVYVVEGFMDAIALYKAGYENVVALMGTAFTKENAAKLSGYNVILLLDSDNAGISATIKSIKILRELKINTSVIQNEEGKDPDDIFNDQGVEGIKEIISNKITDLEFIYNIHAKKYSSSSMDDVKQFINSFKKYLMNASELEKGFFANKIKNDLGVPEEISLEGVPRKKAPYKKNVSTYKKPDIKKQAPKIEKKELDFNTHSYTLIRSLLKSPTLTKYYETKRHEVNFIDNILITISNYIIKAHKGEAKIPNKYKEYINDNINIDGDTIETNDDLDKLIKLINLSERMSKKRQIKVKLKDKGV